MSPCLWHCTLLGLSLLTVAEHTAVFAEGDGPKPARVDLCGDALPDDAVARLGSVRFHQPAGIVAVAFAPDSKRIVAVGMEEKALSAPIWDAMTGKEIARLDVRGQGHSVRSAAWSPDGKYIALNRDLIVELYDAVTGKLDRQITCKHQIISCAFSPEGKWLVAGLLEWNDDNPIRVWEVATGRELDPFIGRGVSLNTLTFSADGKRLFSGSPGGGYTKNNVRLPSPICIWEVATRKKLYEFDHANSNAALAPDGTLIALDHGKEIRLVAVDSGELRCRIPALNGAFAFTPDSKAVAVLAPESGLGLFDAATGKELRHYSGPLRQGTRLAGVSPDGQRVAVITGHWLSDGAIRLWDTKTGAEILPSGGHTDIVNDVAYAPDGKRLASASQDRTVRIWDPATGKQIHRLNGHAGSVLAVAFAPDGKTLASFSADGTTRLWDPHSGQQIARIDNPPGRMPGVFGPPASLGGAALSFTRDGQSLVAVADNGMAVAWNVSNRKETRRHVLDNGIFAPFALPALLPGRDAVLMGNTEQWFGDNATPETLGFWSLKTGTLLRTIPLRAARENATSIHCAAVATSPEGSLFASSQSIVTHGLRVIVSHPTIRLWERITGKEILCIKDAMSQAMTFSANGQVLAAGEGGVRQIAFGRSWFGAQINFYDTWTGERYRQLAGHAGPVHAIAFAPDGKTIASGSADHTILIWKTPGPKRPTMDGDATKAQIQGWWDDLKGADAIKALEARAKLAANPKSALAHLRAQLKPLPPVDPVEVADLLKSLDSLDFEVRDKAHRRLEQMEERAEPLLRQALAKAPSLEVRRRLELLLDRAESIPPYQLQALRALSVLERIGNDDARRLLATLAGGPAGARLTTEAQACLDRLGR
jgi:WD40 repeat protein